MFYSIELLLEDDREIVYDCYATYEEAEEELDSVMNQVFPAEDEDGNEIPDEFVGVRVASIEKNR